MIDELTAEGEPAQHQGLSRKVVCINDGPDSSHYSIADADDNSGVFRGLVWAIVLELGLAVAGFLYWQL